MCVKCLPVDPSKLLQVAQDFIEFFVFPKNVTLGFGYLGTLLECTGRPEAGV